MRCRFCDTEIAAKALICYRCGRATTDPKVAAPTAPRGMPLPAALGVTAAAAAAAFGLPEIADGTVLYAGWAALTAVSGGALAIWWGGRGGRK